MLQISDLPRDDTGWPIGRYTLSAGELTDDYPGAHFRNGVAEHVAGRDVARLVEAMGPSMGIAPSDAETAEACARHIYDKTGDGARAKALRQLFSSRARRGRAKAKAT